MFLEARGGRYFCWANGESGMWFKRAGLAHHVF